MGSPETASLTDDAVLWTKAGHDASGEATVNAPVQIECRWIWKKTQSTDRAGNTVMLDATLVVAQEIEDGSILWEGTLEQWTDSGSEETNPELMEVKTYKETKDIKGRDVYRELGLSFYRGRLPTVAS